MFASNPPHVTTLWICIDNESEGCQKNGSIRRRSFGDLYPQKTSAVRKVALFNILLSSLFEWIVGF